MRLSLNLTDEDHHAAIRILANEEPQLLKIDAQTLELTALREQAFADSVEECMTLSGIKILDEKNLKLMYPKLNTLISESGLNDSDIKKFLAASEVVETLPKRK